MIIAGGYLITLHKWRQHQLSLNNVSRAPAIQQLMQKGEKIRVQAHEVEIKSRSFQQDASYEGVPTQIEIIDGLYDNSRNSKSVETAFSYLVFYKADSGKTYKFVSQALHANPHAVELYLQNRNGVDLYVDPSQPSEYYFDFS